MFERIKLRLKDMKTLKLLISGADDHANKLGQEEPGAEHFVLSALNLPDGTAKRAFAKIGENPDTFLDAIKKQQSDALSSIGVSDDSLQKDPEPIEQSRILHNSKPSGNMIVKRLYELKKKDKDKPILGAHVLLVATSLEYGTVPRALRAMGVEIVNLAAAATAEGEAFYSGSRVFLVNNVPGC